MPILFLVLAAIAFPAPAGGIEITILYNNVPHAPECRCQWGFACLVRGTEETILFDTGGDGRVLLANMQRLGVDPGEIDCVVLSHSHGDHTGGVRELLPHLKPIRWYIPADFEAHLRRNLERAGHTVIAVTEQVEICPDVYSTGELGSGIKEQSLVVETEAGLVVITGCAHPGIVHITATARKQREQKVHLILGGFHLGSTSEAELSRIVEQLQALGVENVAPSHCSGDRAIRLFADTWKEDCLSSGCGARISVP
jgi:7,8-dihydropterin-6-yl-methyl-4-(beta-D-ribofuranosyl)aminobenzene 5'-phosphate synthase